MAKNKLILLALLIVASSMLTLISASSITDRTLGNENAPVTIEMFADFECPYCAMWHDQTFPLIKENYIDTGKVKLIVRYMPLKEIHPNAENSAVAAQCASDQGKFFEYSDLLYNHQDALTNKDLASYASNLNLDAEQFDACINDPSTLDTLNKDIDRANEKEVQFGTPSFFINGKQVLGAQPYVEFEKVIDQALANTNPYLCTDINKDRVNDDADISKLTDYAFNGVEIPQGINADINGDGVVNILDVTALTNYISRHGAAPNCLKITTPAVINKCGDTNGDGVLDQTDLDSITSYAFDGVEIPSNVKADINGDGVVDVTDVVTMTNYVKRGAPEPTCAQELPVVPIVPPTLSNTKLNNVNEGQPQSNPTLPTPVIVSTGTKSPSSSIVASKDPSLEDLENMVNNLEKKTDEKINNLQQKVDENTSVLNKILKVLGKFFKF